jgi:hypothetical protein
VGAGILNHMVQYLSTRNGDMQGEAENVDAIRAARSTV